MSGLETASLLGCGGYMMAGLWGLHDDLVVGAACGYFGGCMMSGFWLWGKFPVYIEL